MHSSYEELNKDQKAQVDAFLFLMVDGGVIETMDEEREYDFVKEHVSNLVVTCLSIADMERWEKGNRGRKPREGKRP